METTPLSVHDAVALINQTLEYAYPTIVVEGEVSSFKINQQKYVFFDIKDERATLNCFMMVFQLRTPIEDGMRVRVVAQPKITQWGKFSLTVRGVQPVGEGNLKRSFELLYAKLDKEGLFAAERKRSVPSLPGHIAVISSTQAAGYADFIKILNERWGGVEVTVAHTVVQGIEAPKQIIQALSYLNQLAELPDVIVIVRGGGSLDDLSAFNDEPLVRAIATSRVPVVTGIGHEVDTTLADLAADRRAATPSNAAMLVVPDRQDMVHRIDRDIMQIVRQMERRIRDLQVSVIDTYYRHIDRMQYQARQLREHFTVRQAVLAQLDPRSALKRGYSLLFDARGKPIETPQIGQQVTIETKTSIVTAGVTHVEKR